MPDVRIAMLTEHGGHRVALSVEDRRVVLPPLEHLAFYVGLGALAVAEIVPPPVAVVIGLGHVILDVTRRPGLRALAEALAEA